MTTGPAPDWVHIAGNALVLPAQGIVYLATPKNACTSLKWEIARLLGLVPRLRDEAGQSLESNADLTIHDGLRRLAPELTPADPEAVRSAMEPQERFVFAVSRDPAERFASAWQSKLLLRESLQTDPSSPFADPFLVAQASLGDDDLADIVGSFDRFTRDLHRTLQQGSVIHDPHFRRQSELLPIGHSNLHLLPLERIQEAVAELERRFGQSPENGTPRQRRNDGLLSGLLRCCSPDTHARILEIFAADYEALGLAPPPAPDQPASAVRHELAQAIRLVRERHHKGFRTALWAFEQERRTRELEHRCHALEQELAMLQANRAMPQPPSAP
jgi:hypothetical protein